MVVTEVAVTNTTSGGIIPRSCWIGFCVDRRMLNIISISYNRDKSGTHLVSALSIGDYGLKIVYDLSSESDLKLIKGIPDILMVIKLSEPDLTIGSIEKINGLITHLDFLEWFSAQSIIYKVNNSWLFSDAVKDISENRTVDNSLMRDFLSE